MCKIQGRQKKENQRILWEGHTAIAKNQSVKKNIASVSIWGSNARCNVDAKDAPILILADK